jgi:hypothetical protein
MLPKGVLSLGERPFEPYLSLTSLYVLVSRVKRRADLCVLRRDALPLPLTGKDFVTRAAMVGRASMLALQMLCDIKDRVGVQGLNPDWHARDREDPPSGARVDRCSL